MSYVDEKIVLDFYLQQIKEDKVKFLEGNDEFKQLISVEIVNLKDANAMHDKIEVAKKLWKLLFESSMGFIDPDKRGYDELFKYFDEYVNFEELIFASDSFYRDHTLHCLWVYFLGEYIYRNEEYSFLMNNMYEETKKNIKIGKLMVETELKNMLSDLIGFLNKQEGFMEYQDSIRCVSALAHDLGYPLKKIYKINSCIGRILPYFSLYNYDEFNFNYTGIQENYIHSFLQLMNTNFVFTIDGNSVLNEEKSKLAYILSNTFITDGEDRRVVDINKDFINGLNENDKGLLEKSMKFRIALRHDIEKKLRYSSDFEQYHHGIMSAFLLTKLVNSFTTFRFQYTNNTDIETRTVEVEKLQAITLILNAIADHTSTNYQIRNICTASEYLALIDELEEFSRISRANQNRQFIIEFCKTSLSGDEGILQIDFIFDNENIADLDPEKAFKGRCKRFLTLFNIKELDEKLKIRLRCISRLSYNDNTYSLEIGRRFVKISINDVEQNIPKYLSSRQFYTREQYEKM
ncbi:MAG: hypothetical protein ACOZCL_09325 [Bacillota bacterium]